MAITRVLSTHSTTWGCSEEEKPPLLLFVQRARQLLLHTSSLLCHSDRSAPFTIGREISYLLTQHKETPHSSTVVNVKFLVEELRESLAEDSIATDLIGDRLDFICSLLENQDDINGQLEAAELLLNRLAQIRYFNKSSAEIIKIITSGGKEKEKLIKLTEGFIAGVRDAGYPAQTIYHLLNVSFLDKSKEKMSAKDRLEKFFSNFDLKVHEYTTYFGVSGITTDVAPTFISIDGESFERSSVEATKILEDLPASSKRFFTENKWENIVIFKKIKALDPQSARKNSERRLRRLDDILKFSIHKQRFTIENQAIVIINEKGNNLVHSNRPRSAILRVPHDPDGMEPETLKQFSSIFRTSKTGTVNRFIRAIELHGTALSAPEEESQLLNLWIAFETLFVRKGNTSKIKEVLDAVGPYISGRWISYQISELFEEIKDSHEEKWNELLKEAEDLRLLPDNFALAAAISMENYKKPMTQFLKNLDADPLLRQRIYSCIKWAQSAKNVLDKNTNIEKRIKYDINRIYRTRNQIVHIGKSTEGLGEIVQSAHYYLDIILNVLAVMLGRPGGPRTIEQANMEVQAHREVYLKDLKNLSSKNEKCDRDNFGKILFGRALID